MAIVSFHLDHFETFYLNEYFPSIPAIDLARFPDPGAVAEELCAGGFADAASSGSPFRSARVHRRLERVRGRYISTLPTSLTTSTARPGQLEHDVAGGREEFEHQLEWALITATRR